MRRRAIALVAALLSLAALVLVRGGGAGPPLYDGICLPPAYRLLGHTPPPPSAAAAFSGADLLAQSQNVADDPSTPQAQMIFGSGTFAPAAGSSSVSFTITAVPPPAVRPDGAINGNFYDFEATSGGRTVPAAPAHPVTIALASTRSGLPTLSVEHLVGAKWMPLKTYPSGCGTTFDAASPSIGLFALVARGSISTGGGGSASSSGTPVLPIIAFVLVLFAVLILAVRTTRRRR